MRGRHNERRDPEIDLGCEAPLTAGDDNPARYTRRGVSLRWLFGAMVTAVTSVALMGGALIAALDGRYAIEAQAAFPAAASSIAHARRADKGDLVREDAKSDEETIKRTVEVNTKVRQDAKDVIRQRSFAIVSARLVLDKSAIEDVPAFNPHALARREAPTADGATDAIYDMAVDGEITVTVEDFPTSENLPFADGVAVAEPDIERQVAQSMAPGAPAAVPVAIEGPLGPRTPRPKNVKLLPDSGNVSVFAKNTGGATDAAADTDFVERVQKGDTLSEFLRGSGVVADDIDAIENTLVRAGIKALSAGQTLRIAFRLDDTEESGAVRRPGRLSVYEGGKHRATVAMTDEGRFVIGKSPGPLPEVSEAPPARPKGRRPRLYESLFQTLVDNELPQPVRDVVLSTFSLAADLNATVRPGDRLTVLYSDDPDEGVNASEILYVGLTAAGVRHRFYRFKTPDGKVDYYDPEGRTGDKFLLRKPMARGVLRSGFGMRIHPIRKVRRMHEGVDYAAPRGTTIYAAGDGVVTEAGWNGGYGRWVAIRHRNGYETGYAHMSRIAKGISPGTRVEQGQVIGAVGSTGLSTGPHIHYEVRVNGRPVDPLTIRLRRGRELSGQALAAFQTERDKIDDLVRGETVEVASR